MITTYLQGFVTGGGLIVAIGAQNAYVLSQAVKKNHHLVIAGICILCDTLFISLGVVGLGAAFAGHPSLSSFITWGGAAFLFFYGMRSFLSAFQGGHLTTEKTAESSLPTVIATTLAVTLLNPHFYLDTVIFLGTLSSNFYGYNLFFFWAGAVSASAAWFLSLSLGGQLLAPVFHKESTWRILDSIVCVTMWGIALSLVLRKS